MIRRVRDGLSRPAVGRRDIAREYDQIADQWDCKLRDPAGYHYWSYGVFDRLVQPHADMARALLDVGCGTGAWLREQVKADPRRLLVGIDISPRMAAISRATSSCPMVVGDIQRQPFKGGVFDLITSRGDAVVQAYDVLEAFREIQRILSKEGRVWIEMSFERGLFEGLVREDWEVVYRRDSILGHGLKITRILRYHLPVELAREAEAELDGHSICRTTWPESLLSRARSLDEMHLLVGSGRNLRAITKESGLTLEAIYGTGLLGWLISANRLPKDLVKKLRRSPEIAFSLACALARHISLGDCHRATMVARKEA